MGDRERTQMNPLPIDPARLEWPKALAPHVGLHANQIQFLKKKGCPFYGRKTTLNWVREFLAKEAGAPEPSVGLSAHLQH
jgi:hypothetical protein